tara:strand:+ start:1513 stop:3783 length:2271 start_codon:yes stop_codon:yes gene_type:complete
LLDFNSGLTNAFDKKSTSVIFLIRLYFGDESSFTGVSTVDYTDGSDFYKGAVSSMGDISHDLNFFKFTTRQNSISLKIINSALFDSNKRFSDLVGTNNYDNRKFEIYAIGSEESGTTKEIICYGTIAANFEYNQNTITLSLNDYRNAVDTGLPQTIIREDDTSNDFHYAPEENFNKPVPILYGSHKSNSAYDESGTFFNDSTDRWAARSKVPAILVNEFDTNSNKAIAKVDTQAVKTLDDNNIYIYSNDIYSGLLPSNCAVSTSDATVSFKGNRAFAMIPFNMDNNENSSYSKDKFENTIKTVTLPTSAGTHDIADFGVPDVPRLGKIDSSNSIRIFCIGRETGTEAPLMRFEIDDTAVSSEVEAPQVRAHLGSDTNYNDGSDVTADFSSDQKENWDFTSKITLTGRKVSTSDSTVEIEQAWLEVLYTTEDPSTFTGYVDEIYYPKDYYDGHSYENQLTETVQQTFVTPKDIKVVYVSAEGRMFGSYIDGSRGSPGNSFNANDLITHPAYIVEDILRTELGLSDDNINMSSFDTVASATSTYLCGFSQYNRISAFDLINDICRQYCLYFYFNGEGKATIIDKKLTSAYDPSSFTEDYEIDFNECNLKSISKTAVDNVKNKIRIEFDFDYANENNRMNIETSSVNISDWNRDKAMTLKVDCNKIPFNVEASNLTNAKLVATTIHNIYKDNMQTRKNVINLITLNPKFLKSELGDIVSLTNVPSDITLYGTAISNQNFMITKISKNTNKINMQLTQVS